MLARAREPNLRTIKASKNLTPTCHSERSAEDVQWSSDKTMFLHAVELFWNVLVTKKRELASGIFDELKRA